MDEESRGLMSDKRSKGCWSPYGAASAAGKPLVALGFPAVVVATQMLFLHAQLQPLWAAHGGLSLRLMKMEPVDATSVATYNLPHTVRELYKAEEYLLGEAENETRASSSSSLGYIRM